MNTNYTKSLIDNLMKTPATLKDLSTMVYNDCSVDGSFWQCMIDNDECSFDIHYMFKRCFPCSERRILMRLISGIQSPFMIMTYDKNFDKNCDTDDVCCSEKDNTFDAMRISEFERIWFVLLAKQLSRFQLELEEAYVYDRDFVEIPVILVSKHWWQYLVRNNFLEMIMQCVSLQQLINTLMQCGDIELNPGPQYKELCSLKFKKRQYAAICKERKEQQKCLNFLKNENREEKEESRIHKRVEMQMFGIAQSFASIGSAMYLGNKTRVTMNKANVMMDKLSGEISQTLAMFRDCFTRVEDMIFKGFNVLDLVSELVFALMQIAFAKPGYRIASLTIEIFRLIKRFGIPDFTLDDLRNLIYPTTIDVNMQGDDDESFTPEKVAELISPTTIVSLIFVFLSGSFLTVIPKKCQVEEMLKRCGDLGRATKGIKDLNDSLHEYVTLMLEYFRINVLKLPKKETIEEFVSGIDVWFSDVRDLIRRTGDQRHSDKILKDPNVIVEVENIYKRGLEFSREISEKKLTRELLLPFQQHMKLVTDLMKQVDTSGAFGTRPRTQPVVIWLYGESGVGKSGMSWPLAVDLNNMFVPSAEEARNFSKNIYMRNVEQEFWDNYQGQNVVIYDDFGQLKDTEGTPNMEFMELIRTANIAPYPLHMAHLEDKRKTRFTSKVLLLTSNVFNHNVSSLTFPDAFRRRIDLCGKVYNKDEYTKLGYSTSNKCQVRRLDTDKVQQISGEVMSTDVYLVDLTDPETGEVIERGLEYDEFLNRALKKANKSFVSSQKMNAFLENYAERRWTPNVINANLQIDLDEVEEYFDIPDLRPITEVEAGMIIDGYIDMFPSLYNQDGKELSGEEIALLVLKGSTNVLQNNPDADVYELSKRELCAHIWIGENPVIHLLKRWRDNAMSRLNQWKEKMIEFVTSHPFLKFAKILSVCLGLFAITKFWKLMTGPKEKKVIKSTSLEISENLEILPYNGEKLVKDLTSLNSNALEQFASDLISDDVDAVLVETVTPVFVNVAKHVANTRERKLIIYTQQDSVSHHGKKIVFEASVSGDVITHKPVKPVLEASSSGDPTTIKPARPILEADVSADAKTLRQQQRPVIEANVSGDAVTVRHAAPKMLESMDIVPADMQMWKDQVAQNIISNRIFNNLYRISKVKNEESHSLLNGLFVRANIMLVPGHLKGFLKPEDVIELRSVWDVVFTVPVSEIKTIPIVNALGESKEAMLLVFPKYVSSHTDLVKHFSDAESMQKYKRADVCLPLIRYSDKFKKFLMMILGNHECNAYDREVYLHDEKKGDYILRQGLEYKCPTMAGDCGAPVIINETQVLRKIAGIHVAGDRDGMAYAESITQADLERAFKKINVELQISLDLDKVVKLVTPKIAFNAEFDIEDLRECCNFPSTKVIPVGKVSDVIYEPCKTELRPSLVYGLIDEIKTKPAVLRNVVRNGTEVNVKHLNLAKNAKDTPYISRKDIEQAYNSVKPIWLANARPELRRVLTFEETVCGSELSEYLGPINRSSSPGYPWILNKKRGTMGKRGWFGNSEYILDDEVKQACELRISEAKQGRRIPVLWVDTLKDERRPIKKVDTLKTRVFNNGPMDFSLVFRQYYLGFVAHLMENRITNEVSIGTNVYSQDWKKTVRKLQQVGGKVIAGDFSQFDGSLNTCIMEKFADLANEFYDDGEENALTRHVLLADVINSVHLCGDSVYMCTHSQPSGNPITTPLNCFVNSMSMRLCYGFLMRKNGIKNTIMSFKKYVSMVSYGDDNVVNISDEIIDWFNMDTITEAYAHFGFIYTDEQKTENGTVPKFRSIEEVGFLKRGFRFDKERSVWEAPLSMDTILEMPNWCRGSLDIFEGTKVNCENAIMELSMHEREVFEKWSKHISNAFYRTTGTMLEYNTYDGYAEQRYMDYYVN